MVSSVSTISASPFASLPLSREKPVASPKTTTANSLTESEQKLVQELTQTDRKVRTHEAAHLPAAGGLATSGASYGFETGPDGKRYAISGEVQISLSPGRTPEETIARAEQIRSAALAPSDPSAQDMKVAAEAMKMASEAHAELMKKALASRYDSSSVGQGGLLDTQA